MSLLLMFSKAPMWVWMILVYILFIGMKSLQSRIVWIPQMMILPVVFLSMKYRFFMTASSIEWFWYGLGCVMGVSAGLFTGIREDVRIYRQQFAAQLPANYYTLPLLMSFFVFRFYMGFLKYQNVALYQKWQCIEIMFGAFIFSFFLGRLVSVLHRYKQS